MREWSLTLTVEEPRKWMAKGKNDRIRYTKKPIKSTGNTLYGLTTSLESARSGYVS